MLENGKTVSDTVTGFSSIRTAQNTKECGTKTTNTALAFSHSKTAASTSAASTTTK